MNKNQDQNWIIEWILYQKMFLRKFQKMFLMPGFPRYSGKPWAMSLRRKKRWQLGKPSRRSIFLLRRNIYRRQKMNCLRKDRG